MKNTSRKHISSDAPTEHMDIIEGISVCALADYLRQGPEMDKFYYQRGGHRHASDA